MKFSSLGRLLAVCLLSSVLDLHALQLTETHSPSPVVVGGKLNYTYTLHNNDATPALGTVFTNRLPPSTVFVSAAVTNGTFSISNNVFSYWPDSIQPAGEVVFNMVISPYRLSSLRTWPIGWEQMVSLILPSLLSPLPRCCPDLK